MGTVSVTLTVTLKGPTAVIAPAKTGAVVAVPAPSKVTAYIKSPILTIDPGKTVNSIKVAAAAPVTALHIPIPLAERIDQFTVPTFVLIKLNHSPSFCSKYVSRATICKVGS